jgi:hypothetical protein
VQATYQRGAIGVGPGEHVEQFASTCFADGCDDPGGDLVRGRALRSLGRSKSGEAVF